MLLIGSRALVFRAPMILGRKPKDFDFIASRSEAFSWLKENGIENIKELDQKIIHDGETPCEFELLENRPSAKLFEDLVTSDPQTLKTDFGLIPNLDLLYTLKVSHRYLKNSPHFYKTAMDYHRMKKIGAKVRPEYMAFLKLREKETYSYSHPKLNVSKDKFFSGDQVNYIYDHDSIHEVMKLNDKPAYTYFKKEGEEVLCDKDKFFSLPEKIKLSSVLEETYVLALERSQIPHPGKMTPKESFYLSLSKVCSSITSGWWREYAYENIFTALKMYDDSYVERFRAGIESGIVRKIS